MTDLTIVEYDAKNGPPKNAIFKKFDAGKPDFSLIEPVAIELYCEASKIGAKKYGRGNWKNMKTKDIIRTVAATLRHFSGYTDKTTKQKHGFLNGEEYDPIDGQRHLASAVWCLTTIQCIIDRDGFAAVYKAIAEGDPDE